MRVRPPCRCYARYWAVRLPRRVGVNCAFCFYKVRWYTDAGGQGADAAGQLSDSAFSGLGDQLYPMYSQYAYGVSSGLAWQVPVAAACVNVSCARACVYIVCMYVCACVFMCACVCVRVRA